jgi:hypothetical protein
MPGGMKGLKNNRVCLMIVIMTDVIRGLIPTTTNVMIVNIQAVREEVLLHEGSLATITVITMSIKATMACILHPTIVHCVKIDRGKTIVAGVLLVVYPKALEINIQIILVTLETIMRRLIEKWGTTTTRRDHLFREAKVVSVVGADTTMK